MADNAQEPCLGPFPGKGAITGFLKFGLGQDLMRDIADNAYGHFGALPVGDIQRQFDGKTRVVQVLANQAMPGRARRGVKGAQVAGVDRAAVIRDILFQKRANTLSRHGRAGMAEHRLGGFVCGFDLSAPVQHQQGIP